MDCICFELQRADLPVPLTCQGMIMGMRVAASQMAGALFAWTLVGPLVRQAGWAPGPISDSNTGVAGWLVWFSLAIILGESLASLGVVLVRTIRAMQRHRRNAQTAVADTAGHASHQVECTPAVHELVAAVCL